jgi:PIN domain nuclease of toxin-antitoxin system
MLLFDTHALVWLASTPKNLSARARHAIQQHSDELYVSSISALEIAILVKRNRLSLPVAVEEFVDRALRQHGILEIPLDRQIAIASTRLPDIHNDPFDRIIIATALLNGMSILSKDQIIPRYPEVKVVW